MKTLLLSLLAAVVVGAPAQADFEAGLTAYRAGDYETALREWMPLAEAGSAKAQFNVGLLHYHGSGVPVDRAEAAKWFLEAADGGLPRAQYQLGEMYESGDGVKEDHIQALKWFILAGSKRYEDARKRRKKLANKMTLHQIGFAEMHVREWKRSRKEQTEED